MKYSYLVAIPLALTVMGCPSSDNDKEPDRSNFRIAYVDSVAVEDDDEARRLPDNLRELCAVLQSDDKNCKGVYVLDPILVRLDLNKELSLKTTIEKGGSKDINNPKVVTRLVKKHLEEIDVPKEFTKGFAPGTAASVLVSELLATKAKNDTILVFSQEGDLETFVVNKKSYRVFSDTEELRKHMLSVLCENNKANFTLLMNPPKLVPPPPPPPPPPGDKNTTKVSGEHKRRAQVHYPHRQPPPPSNGVCDYATHTLHEKILAADGSVSRGKVLVINCAECGY